MSDTRITVTRTVDAPPARVFALLADPTRHREFDGSGMVVGVVDAAVLATVGQVFRMDMHNDRRGDYRTANHVVVLEPEVAIGWAPRLDGGEPLGHTYTFHLVERADGGTDLTQVHDWAEMTDPEILPRMPRVTEPELDDSMARIASAVETAPPAERSITVDRFVDAPPERVFMLLADPDRHPDIDASGTVRESQTHLAVTEVGDVFVMEMHGADMGDYTVENHVVVYDEDVEIAWEPATPGGEVGGQVWSYRLEAEGDGTRVFHTYDWSRVTLERLLPYLPVVDATGLSATLDNLADILE